MKKSFDFDVVETGYFKDMPQRAQGLYFHLMMNTDDQGFIRNAEEIAKGFCGKKYVELQTLIDKGFIIRLTDKTYGTVYLIRHYWVNVNYDKSKQKGTQYKDAFSKIEQDEDTGEYIERQEYSASTA